MDTGNFRFLRNPKNANHSILLLEYSALHDPNKCQLIAKTVQFCGRLIDSDGVKFNPRNYEALTTMSEPTTVGSLMQLVHGANWMRSAIPKFSQLIKPLHDLLEGEYTLHKSRKKSRLATDASSTHWAGCLTQVDPEEIANGVLPPQEWKHSPVAFVSGSFKGASSRWSTPEQESFAIVESVTRLSHILAACTGFSLFTDHKNILYMLSPTRYNANVARHVVHKTQRWALRLSEFNFTVEHIAGEDNLWADILTRWAAPDYVDSGARRLSPLKVPLITEDLP